MTRGPIPTLLLASALVSPAFAQGPPGGQGEPGRQGPRGPRVEDQLARLRERLSLTDAQVPKIEAILRAGAEESRADRESNLAPEERMKRRRERTAKTDASIDALLTPEQKAKFAEMKKEREERMRDRPGGPGSGKPSPPPPDKQPPSATRRLMAPAC